MMAEAIATTQLVTTVTNHLHTLAWHYHKRVNQLLARPEINLTAPQLMTLNAIAASETCRMSDLARETLQSPGTLTGIVDRLIDRNLVTRVRNTDDRRVVDVTLTDRGDSHLTLIDDVRQQDMVEALAHLSEHELRSAFEVLELLLGAITQTEHVLREQVIGK